MSQILTIDGPGTLQEVSSSRSGTQYRVAGNGFEGWYSSHEIISELDDDETTTLVPFSNDTDANGDTNIVPDDDPHAEDGVTLPWNPKPTEEWGMGVDDGGLTQQPDGADIDLTPTKSTKGIDTDEDPESSTQVYGKFAAISWNQDTTEGKLPTGHVISVDHSSPDSIGWHIHDGRGNDVVAPNEHFAINGRGAALGDQDYEIALQRMEEDASRVSHHHTAMKREAFRQYEAILDADTMVREAAWADVRKKASRLFKDGHVRVEKVNQREIFAKVDGDNGTYNTQVHRKNAFGQGVTWWDCDCEWGKHAYLRQRTFIGRQCSHAYATYMAMQAKQVPTNKNRKINDTTERHTLGGRGYVPYSGDDPSDYGYDPGEDQTLPTADPSKAIHDDPWNAPEKPAAGNASKYVRSSAFNPGADPEDEYVPFVKRESMAARQGGLMVWDDDLAKVMKQIYNQQPPGGATPPVDPSAAAGVPAGIGGAPADMGAPGASPMSADPGADPNADPTNAGAIDPSDPAMDPSMGDPNGAGIDPSGATPSFVRQNTGPTQQVTGSIFADSERLKHYRALDPATQSTITPRPSYGEIISAGGPGKLDQWRQHYDNFMQTGEVPPQIRRASYDSSYPVRVQRFHHAEFTDGNPDNNFEEWGDPNSEDADTFNTVQDLTEDNDPEEAFYDDFYGRSSSNHYADDQYQQSASPSVSDPAPGSDINTPAVPTDQLPVVPRSSPQGGLQGQASRTQGSLDYLLADNDDSSDFSYQDDPDFAQETKDDSDYDEDDAHYDNTEEDDNGRTSSIESWFEDDGNTYRNLKEAERFNDDSDAIVREFQRTAGRQFSYSEQQDLIDENPDGRASQFDNLNLKNSFYEDHA